MNDRSATTRANGAPRSPGVEVADVGALADLDPGVGPQPLVQLAVADVDRHHPGGAPLEQAVGEPAGGRPGVERPTALGVDAEAVEGGVQLLAAAAHEAGRVPATSDGLVGCHQAGGLGARRPPPR